MNFLVKNPRIDEFDGMSFSDEENSNKGLRFELVDVLNPYMRPIKQVIFYNQAPGLIEDWMNNLPVSRGGNLPDDEENPWSINNVDKNLRIFKNAEFYEYDFGGDYVSRYSRDIKDKNGNVIHNEGDIVVDRGNHPRITRKKTILCQFQYVFEDVLDDFGMPIFDDNMRAKVKIARDENGQAKRTWVAGFDPDSVGESIKRMYELYTGQTSSSSPIPDDDDGADYGDYDNDDDDNDDDVDETTVQTQRRQTNRPKNGRQ